MAAMRTPRKSFFRTVWMKAIRMPLWKIIFVTPIRRIQASMTEGEKTDSTDLTDYFRTGAKAGGA
jgi:hypothetical protein